MNRTKIMVSTLLIVLLTLLLPVFGDISAEAGNIDPLNDGSRYAWGENVGWINLAPTQGGGVTVSSSALVGQAWGENVGWITFNPANGGVLNDGAGNLTGYAWGENVGWINFSGTRIDTGGVFHGRAWGENVGWISLESSGTAPFSLKTSWMATPDAIPAPFTFPAQSGVPLSMTVISAPITVRGINISSPISVSGGSYSINNGFFTQGEGTVNYGDVILVQLTSSGSFSTATSATVTIGGVSGTFSATTLARDITPDPITFPPVTGAEFSISYMSESRAITGINTAVTISVSGGLYSINGGDFTAAEGTVTSGAAIRVRGASSPASGTATLVTVTIGDGTAVFSITTRECNIDPLNNGSRYVWGENVGWINLMPTTTRGVVVTASTLTGYAWGENVGWINFNPANGGVINDGAGHLSGSAWGENIGWINFRPAGGGVNISTSGFFSGKAWGENIGWIIFDSNGAAPFHVATTWHAPMLASTTVVASNINPAMVGQAITFTATITSGATGMVTFSEGPTVLCSIVPLNGSGQADCTISSLVAGSHTITAAYGGDSVYSSSIGTVEQTVVPVRQLNLTVSGNDVDLVRITRTPQGANPVIYCMSGLCTRSFPENSSLTLTPQPDVYSFFDTWTGECTGNLACNVSMNTDKNVTATFKRAPVVNNTTITPYTSLTAAIAAAQPGAELRMLDTHFDGAISLGKSLALRGGWSSSYQSTSGIPTTLNGALTVQGGSSTAETVLVKGKLTVKGGSLKVKGVTVHF